MGLGMVLKKAEGNNSNISLRDKVRNFLADSVTAIEKRLDEPDLIFDDKGIRFDYSLSESSRNSRLFVGTYSRGTNPYDYADSIINEFMDWLDEAKASLWNSGKSTSTLTLSSHCAAAGIYHISIEPERE